MNDPCNRHSPTIPRLPRALVACACLMAAAAVAGCDPPSSGEARPQVRDSAGVRIVEYADLPTDLPADLAFPAWSISASPSVVIGSADGDGPEVFGRIAAVAERSDGATVVADAGSFELRAFDRSGGHLWTAGRRGDGPGEFRSLSYVGVLPGDSVVAIGGRIAAVFDPEGRFARQFQLESPPEGFAGPTIFGMTAEGRLMGTATKFVQPLQSGPYRGALVLVQHDAQGARLTDAGREFPAGDFIWTWLEGGAYASRQMSPGLARRAQLSVAARSTAVTPQDHFEILRYGPDGTLQLVLRVLTEPVAVDATVRSRYADAPLDLVGVPEEMQENIRQSRRVEPLPETLPAVGRIQLDSGDRLWVQEWVPPYEAREPVWWVFDPDGTLVARASVPPGFAVSRIGENHALGIRVGAFGVQYVEVRPISRGP